MRTKLILSLVFVLIIVGIFSYNYFKEVKADNVIFSETFSSAVKKDADATTGKWDTVLGQARLLGKDWVNMAETKDGPELLIDGVLYNISDVEYDSGGNPYIVGILEDGAGNNVPFLLKWSPGIGWTDMSGDLGYEILDNSSLTTVQMALDSSDNPYIVWNKQVSSVPVEYDIYFTKWSVGIGESICGSGQTSCWTNMKMDASGSEEITQIISNGFTLTQVADIKIDSSDYAHIIFRDDSGSGNTDFYYTKWNGVTWSKADGSNLDPLIYENDNLSNTPTLNEGGGVLYLVNDSPLVVWYAIGTTDVIFTKWTPGPGSCSNPIGCWTSMDELSLGPEKIDQPNPSNSYIGIAQNNIKIASNNDIYVSWDSGGFTPDVFMVKGSIGSGWTQIDGSAGYTNISNSPGVSSDLSSFVLDATNNPYIVWRERVGGTNYEVYFARWNGSSFVKMDGTPAPENVSNSAVTGTASPLIALDSLNTPYVLYDEPSIGLSLKKWSGTIWGKIDGTAGYELLNSPASSYGRFLNIINEDPYVVFSLGGFGTGSANFTKYLPDYKDSSIIQSTQIDTSGDFINSASLTATDTILGGTNINYFISNNGGGDWYSVPGDGTLFNFPAVGPDLRWKAELSGTTSVTPLIDQINILYKTRNITCSISPTSVLQGQNVTISATTSFTASSAWATVEKNGTILSTINLSGGPNNWSNQLVTGIQNFGQNNVTVYAMESVAPNATFVCNPSTGADWQMMTIEDIPWAKRFMHRSISFNNQLYVIGGNPEHFTNEVWRTADNGTTWSGPVNASWSPRGNFGLVDYQDKLWVMGGAFWEDDVNDVPRATTYNDIWTSSNGTTWNPEAAPPWVNRQYFGYTVFNNKIWVVGGLNNPDLTINRYKQDVWSYDGTTSTWTCIAGPSLPCPLGSTPAWSARFGMPLVAWDEDGSGPIAKKLWLIGGYTSALVQTKEIYSSEDGLTWNLVTNNPAWGNPPGAARAFHEVLVYDDPNDTIAAENMYVMGGYNVSAGEVDYNDVWVTTIDDITPGADWTMLTNPPDYYGYNTNPATDWPSWSARRNFGATVHNNEMWVMGGYEITARQVWNDVWHSDNGVNWNLVGANYGGPFQKRWASQMVGFDSDGPLGPNPDKLFIFGGIAGAIGKTNDVWSSVDGTNWTLDLPNETSAPYTRWEPRYNHTVINYNNKLYLIGGCNSGAGYCLGICSVSKTSCTNGITQVGAAAVYCPDGEICQPAAFEEVWSSNDGLNWSAEPTPPWIGRGIPSIALFNDGTGDKIWMTGGNIWGRCNGGTRNGSICNASNATQCPVTSLCSKICMGGDNKGAFCTIDANCPASVCAGINDRYLNDVWNYDGTTWNSGYCSLSPTTKCNKTADCGAGVCNANKATWPIRAIHTSVAYDDGTGEKLYIMGGWNNDSMKDVWSTPDGKTWTQLADPPWFYSYTHQLFNYDDKILMFGGSNWRLGTTPRAGLKYLWTDKVWSTSDGANWTSVTADAAWPGRDFFAATIFKNRLWLMGGDSAVTGENDVWVSKFDFSNMTFSVSTPPGGGPNCSDFKPEDPTSVSPSCTATGIGAISWNFQDNAVCENGYNLYEAGTDIKIKFVEISNLSSVEENSGLSVNTQYSRYVKAYNSAGESAPTAVSSCFTLAKTPNQPKILSATDTEIVLQIDPNDGNPEDTEYMIKELNSNEFIQSDGTFGTEKVWQTYDNWGADSGVTIVGVLPAQPETQLYNQNGNLNSVFNITLTSGQSYDFVVIARNGDGIETAPSASISSTTTALPAKTPNLVAAKGVGINLALNKTSIFGNIAQAAGLFVLGNAQNPGSRILDEFSFLLNFILLVLVIILIINLFKTAQYLKQDKSCKKCLGVIWLLLTSEPAKVYIDHAAKDPEGNYIISYDTHKKAHLFGRKTLLGALSILALKLIILLTLIFGLVKVNHLGIAQNAPYDQTGQQVNVGDTLNYIIEFANQGTDIAKDVVVIDNLDSNLSYEANSAKIRIGLADITGGVVVSGNSLIFNLGNLNPGDIGYITFKASVREGAEEQTINNLAQVSGSNFADVFTGSTSNLVAAVVVPLCGNTIIDSVEQCDQSATPNGCASDETCVNCRCQEIPPLPVCGNGIKETGEQCDPSGCGADQICSNCICQSNINTNINTNTNEIPPIPPIPPITPPTTPPTIPPSIPPSGPGGINQPIFPPDIPIISDIFNPIFNLILDPVNSILENQQVEQVSQDVVTPMLLAVAVITTIPAILATSIFVLPYLHLIFLEPLLLLFGKKRKKWGIVYNSLSKVPIDLALVRLYSQADNRLIQTRVTDKEGRYLFVVSDPGKYYISVTKPGFSYPTKYLKDEKQDTKFLDLYHGEALDVTEKNAVITANIPLDLAEQKVLPIKEVITSYFVKNLRLVVSYIGMILALLIVLIYPTVITIGALMVHIALFLIFRRLQVPPKPKSWGIIYDSNTKEPLGQSVVRIFDLKFNKLLETQITDKNGRYSFLVGKNEYQLLSEKEGYQPKEVKPVDLVKNEEIVNLDVGLSKS